MMTATRYYLPPHEEAKIARKPVQVAVARLIGTAPYCPDPSFDDRAFDETYFCEHQFTDLPPGIRNLMFYGGPKGVVASTMEDSEGGGIVFRIRRGSVDGPVLWEKAPQ